MYAYWMTARRNITTRMREDLDRIPKYLHDDRGVHMHITTYVTTCMWGHCIAHIYARCAWTHAHMSIMPSMWISKHVLPHIFMNITRHICTRRLIVWAWAFCCIFVKITTHITTWILENYTKYMHEAPDRIGIWVLLRIRAYYYKHYCIYVWMLH